MRIDIHNVCSDFTSYRAQRVKSLFNAENGCDFRHAAEIPFEDADWSVGLVVGASGSGKSSIGREIFKGVAPLNPDDGWDAAKPIIDCIAPDGDFNAVTGALASVGLGDVPAWLRPYHVLSNGQKFRASLARVIAERPERVVIDEFTSVVDRQIAKIGAQAFSKAWRRSGGKAVLLSCHYDVIEWLEPDWVYDTGTGRFSRDSLRRPKFELEVFKTNQSYWKFFKPHYYLDLPMPPAAEYFVGTVDGELVCHLAVAPFFTANAYRATRLVVMPEWQGAGVGTKFLDWVCQYHLSGGGRKGYKLPTIFHTSHPQLCAALRSSKRWVLKSQQMFGASKRASAASVSRAKTKKTGIFRQSPGGFGGHFRAVQGFKYVGDRP